MAEHAARYGGSDALVNSAGVLDTGPLAKQPEEAVDALLDVNLAPSSS